MNNRPPITGPIETDIAARQAHVVGDKPRIGALGFEAVGDEAVELVNHVRAGAGAGPSTAQDLPDYMRVVMKHPDIFRRQMEMGATIYNGLIPRRERELAILRIAWLTQSPYEWGEHVDIGKRNGLTAAEIARVRNGSAAPGWSEFDAAILRGVEELLADYALSDATWSTLAGQWDEPRMIEFPMMVGQYVATALVQNSLRVKLAEDNPGLSHS
jgi:4-carboxymuconolactone decarboxylase